MVQVGVILRRLPVMSVAIAATLLTGASARAVSVTFNVQVPYCTPAPGDRQVVLYSNRETSGAVRTDVLTRVDATHFRGAFEVTTDFGVFWYKYALGDPTTGIEKPIDYIGATNHNTEDRKLAAGTTSTADVVYVWKDQVKLDGAASPRTAAEQVAYCGPYIGFHNQTGGVTISQDSYFGNPVKLELGTTTAYELGTIARTGPAPVNGKTYRNRFQLPALTPGEVYHYRLTETMAGGDVVGPDYTFTAPPAPGEPFRFGFLGDVQLYSEAERDRHRHFMAHMQAFAPHLIVDTGDTVASNDTNASTPGFEPPELGRWNTFFDVAAPLLARAPFMAAMGNHEDDSPYFWDVYVRPPSDETKLDHYAYRYGSIFFVVLYTGKTSGSSVGAILDSHSPWLRDALAAVQSDATIRWRVVYLHRGSFNETNYHAGDGDQYVNGIPSVAPYQSWRTIWEERGVDLVLMGHAHNYTLARNAGIVYLTSCSGAGLHDQKSPPWAATTIYAEHTCAANLFEVGKKTVTLTSVREDGSIIDPAHRTLCHDHPDCNELASPCTGSLVPSWSCTDGFCSHTCITAPELVANPTTLAFDGITGGNDPAAKTVQVTSSSGSAIAWTVSCTPAWVECTPASGTTPSTITVRAHVASLAAAAHNGSVAVMTTGAASNQVTVPVTLTLLPKDDSDGGDVDSGADGGSSDDGGDIDSDDGGDPTHPDDDGSPTDPGTADDDQGGGDGDADGADSALPPADGESHSDRSGCLCSGSGEGARGGYLAVMLLALVLLSRRRLAAHARGR